MTTAKAKCADASFADRAFVDVLGQNQDVVPISSYDTAGSFLILGCNNGSIYYIGESPRGRGAPGGCPQKNADVEPNSAGRTSRFGGDSR